jgi:integrase
MSRPLKGIRRRGDNWRVFVRVNGQLFRKTFEGSTPIAEMRAWRTQQQALYRRSGPPPSHFSFAAKVQAYLAQNQSKVTIRQAADHLERWMVALGRERDPLRITTNEINAVIDDWLRTLKPGTVRKRRMWLRQFYVSLTGDGGPCQRATNPKSPKAGARGIRYETIEQALASMPVRRSAKKGQVGALSLALIRARVMVYTGLWPKALKDVTPHDLDFQAGRVHIQGRQKGDGVEARTLPLTPDGLKAFKAFHAANAYGGGWSISSMGRSVKAAFKRIGYPHPVRLYDLRHSYLTELYRVTHDQATVARLAMHADGSPTTARYTQGAHQEIDEAAVAAFSQALIARRRGAIKTVPKRGTAHV